MRFNDAVRNFSISARNELMAFRHMNKHFKHLILLIIASLVVILWLFHGELIALVTESWNKYWAMDDAFFSKLKERLSFLKDVWGVIAGVLALIVGVSYRF